MRKWIQAISQFVTFACGVMLLWRLLTAYFIHDYSNLWIVPAMFGLAIVSELVGNKIGIQTVLVARSPRPAKRSNPPHFRGEVGCSVIQGHYLPASQSPR